MIWCISRSGSALNFSAEFSVTAVIKHCIGPLQTIGRAGSSPPHYEEQYNNIVNGVGFILTLGNPHQIINNNN